MKQIQIGAEREQSCSPLFPNLMQHAEADQGFGHIRPALVRRSQEAGRM